MPAVLRDAEIGKGSRKSAGAWAALVVGVLIMVSSILATEFLDYDHNVTIDHSIGSLVLMVVVGVIVAVSALMPGLSHSTVLLVFGIFGAFTAAISHVDVVILGSIAVGAIIGALLFSKVIHYALEHYRSAMMMLIVGLT